MNPLDLPLAWSSPRELTTRQGPRLLRTAKPSEGFWQLYRQHREALAASGISVGQWPKGSGQWQVSWFAEVGAEAVAERHNRELASRAAASDKQVPHPEGLEYLPFQRAGIAFVLNVFRS